MNRRNLLALAASATLLAACGSWGTSYKETAGDTTNWRVSNIQVDMPETLVYSGDNVLNPKSDLVWWENNRAQQPSVIKSVLTEGLRAGANSLNGSRPVTLRATVLRFHGMTPAAQTRLTQSGVHNVHMIVQVFDAATGQALSPATDMHADTPAILGNQLNVNAQQGITERKRVVSTIARAIKGWLGTGPDARQSFSRFGS